MTALETQVSGWFFIASAAMLWLGWVLLPAKLGAYFQPGDFDAVYRRRRAWIWIFRVHLFGHVMAVMALVALGALLSAGWARVVLWPAVAVAAAGLLVSALAAAFYYHFGAWGSADMHGESDESIREFISTLQVSTEYVTCLVRFGRVFLGLGLAVLGIGLWLGGVLPPWLGLSAVGLGVAAMAITMGLPDNLDLYKPIFHLLALWLLVVGVILLRLDIGLA